MCSLSVSSCCLSSARGRVGAGVAGVGFCSSRVLVLAWHPVQVHWLAVAPLCSPALDCTCSLIRCVCCLFGIHGSPARQSSLALESATVWSSVSPYSVSLPPDASSSLSLSVAVRAESASALAATLTWIMRDGASMVGVCCLPLAGMACWWDSGFLFPCPCFCLSALDLLPCVCAASLFLYPPCLSVPHSHSIDCLVLSLPSMIRLPSFLAAPLRLDRLPGVWVVGRPAVRPGRQVLAAVCGRHQ